MRRMHRRRNRLENFRLLRDSPLMPADYQDYQYRAITDGNAAIAAVSDASAVADSVVTPNFVADESTHQRNHRKRHVQHKQMYDQSQDADESQYRRQRRSVIRIIRHSSRRKTARPLRSI